MPRHLNLLLSITVSALILSAGERVSFAADTAPPDKEIKKAEKVLTKLSELREAAGAVARYKSAVRKFYPGLYINVSSLRDGVLKTDLSTAVFLYEKAYVSAGAGDATAVDCDLEVRDLYQRICVAESAATRTQLLLAKARLHTNWAEALIRYYRGARDLPTLTIVSEITRERSIDLTLSTRIIAVLRTLDGEVNSYSSLAEFEAQNRIAKVSFDQLSNDFKTVAALGYTLLSSLPRNSLTYHLQNALNSYSDGLFWWQKTYRRKEAVVSANNWTEPPPRNPLGFTGGTIDYAVVCNWRKAGKHIAGAAREIESATTQNLLHRKISH